MLFAFQPTRACIFDISAHQNVWLRSALRSLQLYGNSLFCDRLRLFAICDRLRLYGNQPLDRTWFYLLRSSAITIAGSQTIAEVFPYDRRRSQTLLRSAICDLRSAIIWKPAFNVAKILTTEGDSALEERSCFQNKPFRDSENFPR